MTSRTYIKREAPFELFEIAVLSADDNELVQISNELRIGLSQKEMREVKNYFFGKKRNPTDLELQSIGQTWSEHCYHKTFKGSIVSPKGELIVNNMLKTYISKVTEELNFPWCISVFEDNAGIIEFEDEYAIAVKVETHNHPSAIEPFGGAATGVGGAIRDVLGVWADPIACTDVLCFGPLDYDYKKLPSGVKHPKYLFRGVIAGIGHYGNNMGIPTINGAIFFDEGYTGNVVVYCGCLGILPIEKFIRDTKPGDIAILAGGRTGRDGIHGVTFASAELTKESEKVSRPAVQIANPIEEEKLKRAIIEVRDKKLGSAITDLGGGGLSSAIGEMAYRSGCGVHIKLEKVPLKQPSIAPWEIYISESQERMLLSIRKENLQKVLNVFECEGTEATPIGEFTDDKTVRITYREIPVANLDLHFLFGPPKAKRIAEWKVPHYVEPNFHEPDDLTPDLLRILSSPNIASKESVIRTYDHEVKGNTVLKPLHGEHSGPSDAAIIKPLSNSWRGIVVSCGMNSSYGKIDPYWMAASAIDEAIRNNVSVGGRRIALLDNFTGGNPEKIDRIGEMVRACQACYDFAKIFETPFISGKDSLFNESPMGHVPPTLLITAVGIIPNIKDAVSMDVKCPGDHIYIVGTTYRELGSSEYYKLKGFVGKTIPRVRGYQTKRIVKSITNAIDSGYIKACHDLSEGGLASAAAEMALSGDHGIEFSLRNVPKKGIMKRNDFVLFSESNSRFLLEVSEENKDSFELLMKKEVGSSCTSIGKVKKSKYLHVNGLDGERIVDASLDELRDAWKSTFGVL